MKTDKQNINNSFLKKEYQNNNIVISHNNPSLTVGTYNLAAGVYNNCPDAIAIGQAIKTFNADFVGLQEVDKNTIKSGNIDQAKIIAEQSGMYYFFNKTFETQGGEYGTAVLSKYPFKNVQAYNIYSGDQEQRQLIVAEVEVPGFIRPIHFVNIHTDFHVDGKIRLQQMLALNEIIDDTECEKMKKDFPELLGGIIICMGDFNDTSTSNSLKQLRGFWTEARDQQKQDYRTWPAANPTIDFDHIFTSNAQRWNVSASFLPNSPSDQTDIIWPLLSDHLPLVEKLTLLEY